jgi:hypothetical protein
LQPLLQGPSNRLGNVEAGGTGVLKKWQG